MRGGHLCDELIVDIFTRLPTKSLIRFRSLSKSWYSYIASPNFVRMYTCRSQQKLLIRHRTYNENQEGEYEGFYTLHSRDELPLCPTRGYIDIPRLKFPFNYSVIVGSCDGIVCLFDYNDGRISLWNPSIMRVVILPDCPQRCYSEVEVAFGYDPIIDDYKVVSIPGVNVKGEERSYVYAMKTNGWCVIGSRMPKFSNVRTKACFVSGAMHWLVQRGSSNRGDKYYILTFDLSTLFFSRTVSPDDGSRTLALAALEGCLAVIIYESRRDQRIWVKRDDASWSVEMKKESEEEDYGCLKGLLQLGGTSGDLIFDLYSEGFQVYNPKRGTRSRLVDFNDASFLLDIVPCVENFQLLDMGTSC